MFTGDGIPQGCTSFCLDNNGYAVFGANYDYAKDRHDGLVFVNKRNVTKSFPLSDSLGKHVCWTSKYGSVSFNFIASQTSWAGMNEAGLVIYMGQDHTAKEKRDTGSGNGHIITGPVHPGGRPCDGVYANRF